ncbi:MAG: hypothetical protein LBH40_00790 [Alphaproteobacteria bacterium]|jgi:hypothetical protein|nr:hypothetical protein [Alphaproteobacteria bacterium]
MFNKVKVKPFKDLEFKEKLVLLKEVVGLGRNGYPFFLNKQTDLIDKTNLENSKIFSTKFTFNEAFTYFKLILENIGLDEALLNCWGNKIFISGIPISNIEQKDISVKDFNNLINLLANQYATVWSEYYEAEEYDYVLYENLMQQPLENLGDYLYLKEHEIEHRKNKGI